MAESYSPSRLETFERCPRRFYFRYRLRIPAESESIEAFVGKRVHEVLERLYRATARVLVPTLAQVHARYHRLFDAAYDAARVRIARVEERVASYRELGAHCLSNYYHDHYPFDHDETLGLEQPVQFQVGALASGPVHVRGFIDRVSRDRDGAVLIHDYKTGARVPSQQSLDQDLQLALYELGWRERHGEDRPVRLVWHFVRRGILRTSERSPAQRQALRGQVLSRVARIREEKSWTPRPGPLCRWCEYRDGCAASPMRRPDVPPYEERPKVQAAAAALEAAAIRPAPAAAPASVPQLALPLG